MMVPVWAVLLCACFYFVTVSSNKGTLTPATQVVTAKDQYALGSVCVDNFSPPTFSVWIVKFATSADVTIAFPTDFQKVWSNVGIQNSVSSASFWRPVCPDGYVAMGHYVAVGFDKPDTQSMVCMSVDMAGSTSFDAVWTSMNIPSVSYASMWQIHGMYYLYASTARYPDRSQAYSFYEANSCPGHPACNGLGDCNKKTGECSCMSGFGGPLCQDINECGLSTTKSAKIKIRETYLTVHRPTPPCSPCLCNNTVGSYICADPLSFTTQVTNPLCTGSSDGRIIVNAKGGSGTYLFDFGRGKISQSYIQSLSAGTYYVTVSDTRGCTAPTAIVTLNEPRILSAKAVGLDVRCGGTQTGNIKISGFGGAGSYTYQIDAMPYQYSNSFDVFAGQHLFTVKDANFCAAKGYITIREPPALVATSTHSDVICHNSSTGNMTARALGGTGSLQYRLEPNYVVGTNQYQNSASFSSLPAGTYQVLNLPSPYSSAPPSSPTLWKVSVKDANGCVTPTVQTITQPPTLLLSSIVVPISCSGNNDASVTAGGSGGAPPYKYMIRSATYMSNNGAWQDDNVFTMLPPGDYVLYTTDSVTCVVTKNITILDPLPFGSNASMSSTNPTECMGDTNGQLTLSSIGGTSPYSYPHLPFFVPSPLSLIACLFILILILLSYFFVLLFFRLIL